MTFGTFMIVVVIVFVLGMYVGYIVGGGGK